MKPIDWSLKNKQIVFCSELTFGITFANIETMNTISRNLKIN